MEYQQVLEDFAERTLRNLERIRSIEDEERRNGRLPKEFSVYAVTQQLNSLLGLIVFPKETYLFPEALHISSVDLSGTFAVNDALLVSEEVHAAPADKASAVEQRGGMVFA